MEKNNSPKLSQTTSNELPETIPITTAHYLLNDLKSSQNFSKIKRPEVQNGFSNNASQIVFLLDIDSELSKFDGNDSQKNVVKLFGITEDQNSALICVENYLCHISIEYPEDLPEPSSVVLEEFRTFFNERMRREACILFDNIIPKVEFKKNNILKNEHNLPAALMVSHIIVYFSHPYYIGVFKEHFGQQKDNKIFKIENGNGENRSLEDMLTVQFLADTKLKVMSWIEIKPEKFCIDINTISTCQIELITSYENISALPLEGKWMNLPPLRILSIDIECDCIPQEKFPDARYRKVLQIANAYEVLGQSNQFDKIIFTLDSCLEIDEVEVRSYNSESEMLKEWKKFLLDFDPDIITGYNLIDFDLKYIKKRSKILEISDFETLGRTQRNKFCSKIIENSNEIPSLSGRAVLDVLKFIYNQYPTLNCYKLESVSNNFLNEKKMDVSYEEISEFQNKDAEARQKLAKYCVQDAVLALKLFKRLGALNYFRNKTKRIGMPIKYLLKKREAPKNDHLFVSQAICEDFEQQKDKSFEVALDQLIHQHMSESFVFKAKIINKENTEIGLQKENLPNQLLVILFDEQQDFSIISYLDPKIHGDFIGNYKNDEYVMITDFRIEQTPNGKQILKICQATVLDISREAIYIFDTLSRTIKIDRSFFESKKEVEIKPQTVKKQSSSIQKQKTGKESAERKPKKVSSKKPSSTSDQGNKKIYDYFKLVSVKRSLPNEKVIKPHMPKSSDSILNKRSFGEFEKNLNNKSNSLEPVIHKNIKLDSSDVQFSSISSLSRFTQNWVIKVRVYGKTTKKYSLINKIYLYHFVSEVVDESGNDISLVFSGKEMVDEYYEKIVIGGIYVISGGQIQEKAVRSYKARNNLQIRFESQTPMKLESQQNSDLMPKMMYHFTPLSAIKNCLLETEVSVIGLVVKVKAEQITKKDKTIVAVKKVVLTDHELEYVELVLWDKLSELKINQFDILIISRAKVRKYNDLKHLALNNHSQIMNNYFLNFDKISVFYKWAQDFLKDRFGNYSRLPKTSKDSSLCIQEILSHPHDVQTFETRAYVTYINEKTQSYQACPTCRKSLNPIMNPSQTSQPVSSRSGEDQSFKPQAPLYDVSKDLKYLQTQIGGKKESVRLCPYCANYLTQPDEIALKSAILADFTGTVDVTAFGNVAQTLSPIDQTQSTYPLHHEFKLKMRSGLNSESERKYTLYGAIPIDYKEECLDIIRQLELYKNL